MSNQTCGTCRWRDEFGYCRRMPPTAVWFRPRMGGDNSEYALFPAVADEDWCGEWQPPEQPDNPQDRSARDA